MKLGVNIDHVATLRQARYSANIVTHNAEPNVLAAAKTCEAAGANSITIHLRADRRHIQDADLYALHAGLATKLNLEMGNTPEILKIALAVRPADVCLVPENRAEVTTEGGLNVVGQLATLRPTVASLREAGVRVSLFIEPDHAQIEAAHALGAEVVELHTGAFANAQGVQQNTALAHLMSAAHFAQELGLQVNAGHGINYENVSLIRRIPHLVELNIGHSIVSRAIFVGLDAAVREMRAGMKA